MRANILPFDGTLPVIGDSVYVAPTAAIIGDVHAGDDSSFWFQVVVRGDVNFIRIGSSTNIQDGSVLHVTSEKYPLFIGSGVTVGHSAVVHGCKIGDGCLIGTGSRVLDGAVIEPGAMVGAGAVVTPGTVVPSGHLALGIPAKTARPLRDDEREMMVATMEHYATLKDKYISDINGL
ncbi:UDP-3-O-[3-hydroxymyristoyl] glucosamine N-acyltransferase [bacterium BMS3Abin14]|nr:UDP-3-O-[3-hydroxymyristoyl] glucosamine N-acyltransferase [bacterium BMS3Abin14]